MPGETSDSGGKLSPFCMALVGLLLSTEILTAQSSSHHSDVRESKLEDVWRPLPSLRQIRPVYRPDPPLSREMKTHETQDQPMTKVGDGGIVLSEMNNALKRNIGTAPLVSAVESVRAIGSTAPTPIGESLQTVTKQLLRTPTPTDMVLTDVRTPPKIKSQMAKVNEEMDIVGKGEAVPIVLDDHDAYETIGLPDGATNQQLFNTAIKNPSATPPTTASGISTWILLSNSDSTTQSVNSQRKTQNPTTVPLKQTNVSDNSVNKRKPQKPNSGSEDSNHFPSTEKPERKVPTQNTKVIESSKDEVRTPITINLQDSKFKNRQPVIMGRVPTTSTSVTTKNKTEISNAKKKVTNTTSTSPQPTSEVKIETNTIAAIVPTRRRPAPQTTIEIQSHSTDAPLTVSTTMATKRAPVYHPVAVVPTTSVVIETESADPDRTDEMATQDTPLTKRPSDRPSNKKKKKPNNKRRRRPASKDSEDSSTIESKITEESNSTKTAASVPLHGSRPLSTRIYNYLAREVMPSVGVGVVGLLLTAGLAGLFLYPFGGGVAARRTSYESTKNSLPSPDGHMYYYNEYSSKSDIDNAQAEESVFSQVLSGMTQPELQYEPRPNAYGNSKNNNNNKNGSGSSINGNFSNHNMNGNNNNNNNKFKFDVTSGHHTPSIVYPSSKDTQKYSAVSSEHGSNSGGIQDTATGYSTLTHIPTAGGSSIDTNYPSLTTDTITDSRFTDNQYSSTSVSGSSGSAYTGAANKKSGSGIFSGSMSSISQNSDGGSSYSSIISPSPLTGSRNSNLNSQYPNPISGSSTKNSQIPNVNPSYSSVINNPSISLTESDTGPQYQSLVGGSPMNVQSSTSITGNRYSNIIGSVSMDNSASHFSKQSANTGHQYSSQLSRLNEHDPSSQYSADDNDNPNKYPSLTTHSHTQNKYPPAGEYTAYNNPSEISTQGMIGYGSSSIDRPSDNHRVEQDLEGPLSSGTSSSNNWKEIEFNMGDTMKDIKIKEEDKSDKSQPQFTALHSHQYMSLPPSKTDRPSFPSQADMISITGGSDYQPSLNSAERHRQTPLASIEHGPRYFKLTATRRKKRQAETEQPPIFGSSLNEIDGELPKDDPNDIYQLNKNKNSVKLTSENDYVETTTSIDTITTTLTDAMVTDVYTEENNNTSSINGTAHESLKDTESIVTPTGLPQQTTQDVTFLGIVRRLAHLKLKWGLSFLRSTSQVVSKYFQTVQQRMEKVMRRLEKRARSYERMRNEKESSENIRRTNRNERKHSI